MSLKSIIKRIVYKQYCSNDAYIEYLRKNGAQVGNGTYFYNPEMRPVDEGAISFLKIGENCRITKGVLLLLHDYSYAVMRVTHHGMLAKSSDTIIGNNVFIGARSIILMNAKIGDNVIIGAGSIVSGEFGSNVVIGGNPAKVICSLDDYYNRCLKKFDLNAKCYYLNKSRVKGRVLEENEMGWYVALWETDDFHSRKEYLSSLRVDGDDANDVVADVLAWKPIYKSFQDFVESIEK